MVFLLDNSQLSFPPPELGDPDGLIAVGGDLSFERLILAYSHGFFPWFSFRDSEMPHWYCPMERFVIVPSEIHISHSMRNLQNKNKYSVTVNHDFHGVIRKCSELRIEHDGAWLGEDMINAYTGLYEKGFAASVEVWEDSKLVGGLYGVTMGRVFCGESMFSIVPGASKIALIHLARKLESAGNFLVDCQFETPHLKSMGGRHISYQEYMSFLSD